MDDTKMHIANCQCCLLAEQMRDCPACRFNAGLATKTTKQPSAVWQKFAEQREQRFNQHYYGNPQGKPEFVRKVVFS